MGAEKRSEQWALQPLKRPVVPKVKLGQWSRGSIDYFVLEKLEAAGLAPAPEADRATLIRRLCYDLIGLPPGPVEIDEFVRDPDPEAYAKLVERLLASSHYGERWGRHWLDVARYTESQGFEYDKLRENAWHYRDYVIDSFNKDKPYDRFVMEQIAGDVMEPVTTEKIVATSLLVCGPWDEAGNGQANQTQRMVTREEELEDLISVVSQSFLGMTVNCARCHAHKFDPIPQEDYYRFKAVFEGVRHGERAIAPPLEIKARERRVAALNEEIAEEQRQLDELESVARLEAEQGAVRGAIASQIRRTRDEVARMPGIAVSYAGMHVQPPPTHRLLRGSVKSPAEVMAAGALSAVADPDSNFHVPADAPEAQRRLKLAAWIADPRNPLTARVMANRVWHYHFGHGIVDTPNDFGAAGEKPSHSQLLDWLAATFIERGWSVKELHRLIVNSATYRQASTANSAAAGVDADDRLLWRFAPHRLEAEAVRDAMLCVSGQINLAVGGPSFKPFEYEPFPANIYRSVDKIGAEFNRRTVYRMNVNSGKNPLLEAFDCPDPSIKAPSRRATTTPLQALALMNNSFVLRQAGHFADRVMKESSGDVPAAVGLAYRYALGRAAQRDEIGRAAAVAREHGMRSVCWALLNSTEFLYVR